MAVIAAVVSPSRLPSASTGLQPIAATSPQNTQQNITVVAAATQIPQQPTQPPPAPESTAASSIEISGVFKPNCPAYDFYKKRSDRQLVGVLITIKNHSSEQLSVNPLYVRMISPEGFVYEPALGSCEDQIDTTKIAPGQAVRGVVGFEVEPGTKAAKVQLVDILGISAIGPVTE